MMRVRNLHAGYGRSLVLQGVDLDLHPGEIVALLGRNGAGRTTLARALMGLIGWRGEVHLNGRSLAGVPTHLLARLGLGYVPESRDVFADLTVHQNLLLGFKPGAAVPAADSVWSMRDVLDMFPALQGRLHVAAGLLSGGEQQMLTLGRALLGNPQLMLVDEPAEGLAPQVIVQVASCLQILRSRGVDHVVGIEPDAERAASAAGAADRIIHSTVELAFDELDDAKFDLIVVSDVLEHLVDPWTVTARLATHLEPQGRLLLSVPNVGSLEVVFDNRKRV